MTTTPDEIAVVGAGIIGLAIAFHLQREGRKVVLIERGGVAEGASYGNAGALAFSDVLPLASPGIMRKAPGWLLDPLGPLSIPPAYLPTIAPWLLRFWRASLPDRYRASIAAQCALMRLSSRAMDRMIADAGLSGHVRSDGNLQLYESEAEFSASLPGWQAREREGIPFEHVRGARLAGLQPGLSPRFVVGSFTPHWQTVDDPHLFALALFDKVTAQGARLIRGEVTEAVPSEGGAELRFSDGSASPAGAAVIAAGAWSRKLCDQLRERIPLETERGYNTTLPPGAFDLRRQLTFGGHGFVITPLATGIRIGGAVELGGLKRPPNFARSQIMLEKAAAFLPGLKTGGGKQWMGFRPSLPDTLPVIGASKASDRILYAFGHGHSGLTQCAATAQLIADLLAGRPSAIPLAPFRPARF
ncbi:MULTISPECIES: FAD-dependent oxidoreductase [Rhodomicrobium]|uniref:NAD(P)/FAD-dependent oxidoreductase n=1 Tax=Rhodomicrobium TaxID=1068 RepID=UPI000B4AC8CF|nr:MULTISPECIES: FAD-dependent oxidoreductase [Rhodomicrobium]